MENPQSTFQHTSLGPSGPHQRPTLLSRRRDVIAATTVQAQLQKLRDTGRYDCFRLQWKPIYDDHSTWPVPRHLFWDSDLAKWIEGACYLLREHYDAEVDHAVREMVETMREAQQEDGYLNLHYILVAPGKRFTNLQDMHELYNAGHLIEGALAHHAYYRNDRMLEPILKYVRLIRREFGPGPGQRRGYPGHPEIELALLRLHKATGSRDAYELARFFLEERGSPAGQAGKHYYTWERELRGESAWQRPNSYAMHREINFWYCQAHRPIPQQASVEGHAVRAMYLLTAVADLLCIEQARAATAAPAVTETTGGARKLDNAAEWWAALTRLWDNMVGRKMYLTGGIGAMDQWEGFGIDYFLPQSTDEGGCYAETCAGVGVVMLAERLLRLDLDGRYGDVMELCLYNAVMTAMSLDGRAFTYVNQMGSSDKDPSAREEWFDCSCCPPNLTRLFGSLGGYLWHFGAEGDGAFVNVHLYTTARLSFRVDDVPVELEQESDWPWDGTVKFRLSGGDDDGSRLKTTLRLRVPGWSKGQYKLTPPAPDAKVVKGYLVLEPEYLAKNPQFTMQILGFEPRHISPHPYTNQNTRSLARGPLVYCVEDADNSWETNHFKDVGIKTTTPVTEKWRVLGEKREPYIALATSGWKRSVSGYSAQEAVSGPSSSVGDGEAVSFFEDASELVFIPYYLRANRGGNGHMRVGLLRA